MLRHFCYGSLKVIEIEISTEYIFLSQACMKCPLQRRHHVSYSESLALKKKMIRTTVSRAIEGVEINSIRSNMWDIY